MSLIRRLRRSTRECYTPNFPSGTDAIDNTSGNSNDKIAGFGVDFTIKPTLINQFHAGFMYQASFFNPENLGLDGSTITEQVWNYGSSLYGNSHPRQAISLSHLLVVGPVNGY
jgi:hypothetical protein